MNICLLLFCILLNTWGGRIDEWQTGMDLIVNDNLQQLERASNYPIFLNSNVNFIRPMSQIPKVILMIEQLSFVNQRESNFDVYPQDITLRGFKIRYSIKGPAIIKKLNIRWVAFMDPLVEVQQIEYTHNELRNIAYGNGRRMDQFNINYQLVHPRQPQVTVFLSGFKISADDNSPFCLELTPTQITNTQFTLEAKSKYTSRVKMLRAFIVISSDSNNILQTSSSLASPSNYFDDRHISGLRHQSYRTIVPQAFQAHPSFNTFSQGISGFEVDSQTHLFHIGLQNYFIQGSEYRLSYGPYGGTIVANMQVSILLHPPTVIQSQQRLVAQGKLKRTRKHRVKKQKKYLKTDKNQK